MGALPLQRSIRLFLFWPERVIIPIHKIALLSLTALFCSITITIKGSGLVILQMTFILRKKVTLKCKQAIDRQ
ncbi:hypothetical protein J2T20_003942 [Paenibacillus wynnii]|nr:hypothetical protein [Paenibacillus wynnii]